MKQVIQELSNTMKVDTLGLIEQQGGDFKIIRTPGSVEELTKSMMFSKLAKILVDNVDYMKLRRAQKKGILKLIKMLYEEENEGLAKMPTGTGKTVYFSEILKAIGEPALIKVPRTSLIPQTMRQLHDSGYELDQIYSIPECVYEEEKDRFEPSKKNRSAVDQLTYILEDIKKKGIKNPVIVSTYASLKSIFKDNRHVLDELKALIKILISDEAHHTTGEVSTDMLDYLMDKNPTGETLTDKLHILLTATPDRKNKSLRDKYYQIINILLQECIEDGTLILPKFRGVGTAYLPHEKGEKAPTDTEIEKSGKYVDEAGTPIREKLISKYIEDKKKCPYMPGVVFCGTIDESKEMKKYCELRGLRAQTVTSEDEATAGEIEDMIYNDETDLLITVYKVAEGFDIRPLRAAIRMNASRDPVYKTQGNGRIYRTMTEKDVERIFSALRPKKEYEQYSDEEIRGFIRKTSENTGVYEPDKWVVAAEFVPTRENESGKIRGGGGGSANVPKLTVIEELPNSIEELILCGELDYEYVMEQYPGLTINISGIKDFFEAQKISSLKDLMLSHKTTMLREAESKLSATNLQKVKSLLAISHIKDLNKIAQLLGFEPMTQIEFDKLYEGVEIEINNKDIFDLYAIYEGRYVYESYFSKTYPTIASCLIWQYKYGKNIWDREFENALAALDRDMMEELKEYYKDEKASTILIKATKDFDKCIGLLNIWRRKDNLFSFRKDTLKSHVASYLVAKLNLPSFKDELLELVKEDGIITPEQIFAPAFASSKTMQFLKDEDIGEAVAITNIHKERRSAIAKKELIALVFGEEEAERVALDLFCQQVLVPGDDVFDLVDKIKYSDGSTINSLLGISKKYMDEGRIYKIASRALGQNIESADVKLAAKSRNTENRKKLIARRLAIVLSISSPADLIISYTQKKDEIHEIFDKSEKNSRIEHATLEDQLNTLRGITPKQIIQQKLEPLGAWNAITLFESFDSYYPTIQKLTDVLYPDLNPQDTESIKVFMRRLGLDLLSSATNLKDKTIESITFDDLGNIDRFFERADVKKILPYLYRSDQIDSEEYRSLYLNGAKLHHLSNEIKQYFASLGDEVIDKMRAYSTAPKKENLLQFYNIIHYANPSAQMTPDLFAKMLSDHHSKFKYLSMDTLKLYFDEKLNLKTLEEKKVHIQATSQEPIWSAIYNQISEVSEAKDEEKEKILMNGMLPSPLEILKKNFIIQKVNTQKHFDELLKKIETMQGTDKTQRLLRFGRYMYGTNHKQATSFDKDEIKSMKLKMVKDGLLQP